MGVIKDQILSEKKKYITIEKAMELSNLETQVKYEQFINPQLLKLLKILSFDRVFVKAKDTKLWDDQGREYIDFLGAYGALNIGHNNEFVISSLQKITNLPNLLQTALNPLSGALAEALANITPGSLMHTFFCNSGAEAVEGALKLARIATGKARIIYCSSSFHGKSMGALSVTGREKYRKYFQPLIASTEEVIYGDISELIDLLETYDDIAAMILEPIQGEGGVIVPSKGYLKMVRELCNQYDVLLIADEVQTGFGRTGNWFACEDEEINPDIMCMAKSLGGGIIPVGAYIATKAVWEKGYGSMDKCLLHTSTFGGNTWAMAAGLATIQFIDESNLVHEARKKGTYFLEKLNQLKEDYPLLKDVRGRGLMIGLEFEPISNQLTKRFELTSELLGEYTGGVIASKMLNDYGIVTAYTLNNPYVIRVEPSLTISYEEIDHFVAALRDILQKHKGITSMALSNTKYFIKSFINRGV
ncbi:aminotransferase class-III [Alkaliphilus metalliredigens QYMF]|uniref:Aminotransferase class-III n=1 Tax=Alkaliphilus metalliredigens (strain QYMF) TaxID=293826 RepID=A6TW23_ALKMQ|nr:aspartate aminotransferase family protein [Alkaliphilus metalliredigens]ABR50391.1 aminotransferase class-III [Alkaliphilus metalliredigens QYMF]